MDKTIVKIEKNNPEEKINEKALTVKGKKESEKENSEKKVGMLIVVKSLCEGSYVARITGLDPKYLLKREFLETELEWSKTEKGQFCMYIKDEKKLHVGDIISLKLFRKGETKDNSKEKYYKIVNPVSEANGELSNIIEKISLKEVMERYPTPNVKETQSVNNDTKEGREVGLER
jgi:hypothetical protein